MSASNMPEVDQQDLMLVNAVDLARTAWDLDSRQATASLHDIAQRTGADLDDIAALVVAASYRPLKAVRL